jgi:uncharacterized membrane protein
MYHLAPRRDASSLQSPAECFNTGVTKFDGTSIGGYTNAYSSSFPGVTPYASRDFNAYWKVLKTYRINMSGGSVHKHVYNIKIDHVIKRED